MDPLRPLSTSSPSADPLRPLAACTLTTCTMFASAMLRGLLLVGLLTVLCHGQTSQEVTAEDFGVGKAEPAADRDLVSTLTHTEHDGGGDTQIMQFSLKPANNQKL